MSDQPPFQPTHIASVPQGLDDQFTTAPSTSALGPPSPPSAPVTPPFDNDIEHNPPPLLDERAYEDDKVRKARLVMGPPLGEEERTIGGPNDQVIEGEQLETNELLLADYEDDALDLELTHQRIKTLRGLNIQRFKQVERISLRQNLLTSLGYTPRPPQPAPEEGHTLAETSLTTEPARDPEDVDENDDEDAAKKEAEFPYQEENGTLETVYPLRGLTKLEELDLYDNSLKKVKGLEGLVGLKSLDLSFNLLRSIAPFDDTSADSDYAYPDLDHLYLIQNKLAKIEGVAHRLGLVYLELGGNRIRTIENLPISANLKSLFLGKNKIAKIEGLEGLTGLRTLSIQSNRLTKIEGLETLASLEELYLSHNGLTKIEGLSGCPNLTTLDVGSNKIEDVDIAELECVPLLEEFWANNNQIQTLPILTKDKFPDLATLYLEGNPVQKTMATTYVRKITLEMPQLKQVDANFVRRA